MKSTDINSQTALSAAVWLGIIGSSVLLVLPVFVGTLIEHLHFSPSEAGIIGSADLLGYATASFIAFRVVRKYNWRWIVLSGLTLMIIGNVLSLGTSSFRALFVIRLVFSGVGAGLVICVPYTFLGDTSHPARNTSIYFGVNVVGGTIGLLILPYAITIASSDGLFWLLAATAISGIPFAFFWLPVRGINQETRRESLHFSDVRSVVIILVGIGVFNLGFGGVWAFVERIGTNAGLPITTVGRILSLTYLTAMLGSAVASWQDDRFGFRGPYAIAMLLMGVSMFGLLHAGSQFVFIAAMALMNFAWNYAITYQFSAVFDTDKTGKLVVFIILAEATGLMLGPGIAGFLVEHSGLETALFLGIASGLISLALIGRKSLRGPVRLGSNQAQAD